MENTELVPFLEAVYSLESSEEEWLSRVLDTAAAVCSDESQRLALLRDAFETPGAEPAAQAESTLQGRMASHLRAAFRCRRQLAAREGGGSRNRARWTLVDRFEEGGSSYVVARENQSDVHVFAALTDRERQVVVHAALGSSNKQIAHTLGISEATVRVLMARAAGRLGVRTRKEVLAHAALTGLRPAH